jgi:hypothetical protein
MVASEAKGIDEAVRNAGLPGKPNDACIRVPFNPPQWGGTPVKIAVWTLTKGSGKRCACCGITPSALRCASTSDGEMTQTKASRDLGELLDASDAWNAAFQEKGWVKD